MFLNLSTRERKRRLTRGKRAVKMKRLYRQVDQSWMRKDEILIYWSMFGSLLCVILSVWQVSLSHKTLSFSFLCSACRVFVLCLSLFLSLWIFFSAGFNHVLSLHSSSVRLVSRLFTGSTKMAKCPQSFLPGGVWINSLERHSTAVIYLRSWQDMHRTLQRWLPFCYLFLPLNLYLNSRRHARV